MSKADLPDGPDRRHDRGDQRIDRGHQSASQAVGLTPSGVTRALKPMQKLGIVSTVKSKRDARLAIAALTPAGRELLGDASAVVRC